MGEFLRIMIPLEAAMLAPAWLPLLGAALGNLTDRVRGEKVTPAQQAVQAAKERSEQRRRQFADQLAGRRTAHAAATSERDDASVAA